MAQYQVQDPAGQTHVIEGPDGATPDQVMAQAQALVPKPSELESGLRGAANNFPMAPQAISAVEPGDYSKNLTDWNAKAAEAKAANPVSYGIGATAGTLAPLAIPGVGEAMEAAPIASGAALGAAGALSNTDLTKNPGEIAKEGVEGAVTGGVLGKAGEALGDLAGGAAEGLTNKSNEIAASAVGASPKLLGNMTEEEFPGFGEFVKAHGLLDADPEKAVANADLALQKYGAEIEKLGAGATPATKPLSSITPLIQQAKELEGVKGAARDVRALNDGAYNIIHNGKTFDELQQLKTFYGNKAFDAFHGVKDPVAADIYGAVKQAMNDTIKSSPAEYQEAMTNYKMALDAKDGLVKKLGAARGGQEAGGVGMMGRLVGKLPGQSNPAINLPTAAAVGAMGHPYMALGAATPTLTNPRVQSGALDALAQALPHIPRPAILAAIEKLSQQYGGGRGNQ